MLWDTSPLMINFLVSLVQLAKVVILVQEAIVQLESTHLPDGYHVSLVLLVFNVRANQR